MMESRQTISSLARGLAVLELFTSRERFLNLTEISKKTGINKSGVQRITHTLLDLGYLERNNNKAFRLGPKAFRIGYTVLAYLDFRIVAHPYMEELSQRLGLTVNLSILDRTEIVIIERVEKKKVIDLNLQIGTRLPAYCTAAGKAIMAFLPEEKKDKIINSFTMKKLTEYTISDKAKLKETLSLVLKNGYSTNNQELSLISRTVGAPIFSQDGSVIAAVSIGDNAALFTEMEFEEKYAPPILELGKKISTMLGWSPAADASSREG